MTAKIELLPLPGWAEVTGNKVQQENIRDYARANVLHHTAAQAAEIEALRAEVERLQSAFEQAVEADKDEEVQRLRAQKVAHFIACTDAEAEVKALRSEMERLKRELSARGDYVNEQAIARAERMAEALHRLTDACDDSDGAQYGTLSTTFVRGVCEGGLEENGN